MRTDLNIDSENRFQRRLEDKDAMRDRLAQLAALVERYEQKTYGPTLESLLQGSPREALSLTQEDREWLHHSLPSEDGGRWDSCRLEG